MPHALAKLRDPSAVRLAVLRRALSLAFRRAADPRGVRLERLGSDYGGWVVPVELIGDDWTVWSLGTGHDASFDVEVLRRWPRSRVRAFDPFARHLAGARELAGDDPRYTQHQVAIAAADGPITLTGTEDADTGHAHAPLPGREEPSFVASGRSIASLREELGDPAIQLLKMDIEGAEFDVLDGLDLRALGVEVLCVELHFNVSFARARATVAHVVEQGYRLVSCDDVDLTFAAG
jgi:FkbM family methyltransferase